NALNDFERLLPPPALGPDMQGQQLFGPTVSVRAPVMDACASEGYVRKGDAGGRTIEDLAPAESSDKSGIFGECVMQGLLDFSGRDRHCAHPSHAGPRYARSEQVRPALFARPFLPGCAPSSAGPGSGHPA